MSRFIDKLTKVSQGTPQPMGFVAGQRGSEKPRLQLIASTSQAEANLAGADAGLLHIVKPDDVKKLEKLCQDKDAIPWGAWLKDTVAIKKIVKADCDFVVFPASAPLTLIQDKETGRILEVDASIGEAPYLMRGIEELPVDAILITGKSVLTWQSLLFIQSFTAALTKPVIVAVPAGITPEELQVLWEAGVNGLVVETEGKAGLTALRQEIDKLNPVRRKLKVRASVPRVESRPEEPEPEEEEEE